MARRLIGTVVSDMQDKTIVVETQRRVTHPVYKKQYLVTKNYQAHDEKNESKIGDRVSIEETKPISKHKSFKLVEIIERPEGATDKLEFSDEKKLEEEQIVKNEATRAADEAEESKEQA